MTAIPASWHMPWRKTPNGWTPRCTWLPPGAADALFRPGMLEGDRCAWLDQHGCSTRPEWHVETEDGGVYKLSWACASHVGHLCDADKVSRVWHDETSQPALPVIAEYVRMLEDNLHRVGQVERERDELRKQLASLQRNFTVTCYGAGGGGGSGAVVSSGSGSCAVVVSMTGVTPRSGGAGGGSGGSTVMRRGGRGAFSVKLESSAWKCPNGSPASECSDTPGLCRKCTVHDERKAAEYRARLEIASTRQAYDLNPWFQNARHEQDDE